MPYLRPTYSTILAAAQQDVVASKPGGLILLPVSNLGIAITVLSKAADQQYAAIDWVSKQAIPWTATDEYLGGWATLKGVNRNPATASIGSAIFSGTVGTDFPSGTILTLVDGTVYLTTADATVGSNGSVTVQITAQTAGSAGNQPAGIAISIQSGIPGITTGGVTGILAGGADIETDDSYRSRMLLVYRQAPQGGSINDYLVWSRAVPGVTRAWAVGNLAGAGTVSVFTMFDITEAANNGFPVGTSGVATGENRAVVATGDCLIVANAIITVQPVTALVYSVAPVPYPVNFTINSLTLNSATIQAGISAALTAAFLANADPLGGTIQPSVWDAAINSVSGVSSFALASPTGPIAAPVGSLPILGTITYGA